MSNTDSTFIKVEPLLLDSGVLINSSAAPFEILDANTLFRDDSQVELSRDALQNSSRKNSYIFYVASLFYFSFSLCSMFFLVLDYLLYLYFSYFFI